MPTDGRVPPSLSAIPAVDQPASLFCLVQPAVEHALLPALRDHFALDPVVAVLVERRTSRPGGAPRPPLRRAPVAERDVTRVVPPTLRARAGHLRLVQPMAPLGHVHQDTGILDLVVKAVALEPAATTELWWRVSPRVLARLTLIMRRADEAATVRAMLGRVLDELPGYDPAREPLPGWLDTVVDRFAEDHVGSPPPPEPFSAIAAPRPMLRVAA